MTTKKKGKTKSAGKSDDAAEAEVVAALPDPRETVEPKPAVLQATLEALTAILGELEKPAEPQPGDLVTAVMHFVLGQGVACGIAEEATRRLDAEFVDRNELRVTEAYETEELLGDLGIPDLFERCRTVQQIVAQIYNDQNRIDLGALRGLSITERKGMLQRLPAIPPDAVAYLNQVLTFEEVLLSPRSASRSQQKLGLEGGPAEDFVQKARDLVQPFGHLPLSIGKKGSDPAQRPRCPSCLCSRIQPGKR